MRKFLPSEIVSAVKTKGLEKKKPSEGTGQKHSWDLLLNTRKLRSQIAGIRESLMEDLYIVLVLFFSASAVGHRWRNPTEVAGPLL